ncbi:hypothetical protein [Allofranklinella schreckenbergeri]|uniref:hypothetical protein n=1 Tax=Allofranklinella schreckenbergeri TaxID=1076744 RepID=UPI001EED6880|nr:hypothetical protein [Allofranklinella schreckenbergeri]
MNAPNVNFARRTPHAARRTPHAARRTPHAARRTPHAAFDARFVKVPLQAKNFSPVSASPLCPPGHALRVAGFFASAFGLCFWRPLFAATGRAEPLSHLPPSTLSNTP